MDHTLMDNDCDVSWKEFLVERGIVDPSEDDLKEMYFRQYVEGCLNVDEFLRFQYAQFKDKTLEEIQPLILEHFREKIEPRIYPQAKKIVEAFKRQEIPTVMLTATAGPLAAPVAEFFQLDEMLSTRLAMEDGKFTGEIVPPYCFREGKIHYSSEICNKYKLTFEQCVYYGDSTSDIPMMEKVGKPIAVNPGPALQKHAKSKGWEIERWALPEKPVVR